MNAGDIALYMMIGGLGLICGFMFLVIFFPCFFCGGKPK